MNRSRALIVFAVVLAVVVGQLSGAGRAYAVDPPPTFTDSGAILAAVSDSSVAWGDYNSDGKLDILLAGYSESDSGPVTKIYANNGNGMFSEDKLGSELTGLSDGSVAWGDYNLDGRPDILVTGQNGSGSFSKIYKNNGADKAFSEDVTADGGLIGVRFGSAAWGDYDSDGRPEILLTGDDGLSNPLVAKIYKMNGSGAFVEDETADADLIGADHSSAAWGDYNSDGRPDILIAGHQTASPLGRYSKIYRNNGPGAAFTRDTTADGGLIGVDQGSVAWGDYDSDGKPDILLTGRTDSDPVAKIYKINGFGAFVEDATADSGLTGVQTGSAAWGDYDADGNSDILLAGLSTLGQVSKVFKNNGSGVAFSEDTLAGLTGVERSSVAWGDYDPDGKLDILLTGYNDDAGAAVSRVYQNQTTANTTPSAPSSLLASFASGVENLSWAAASDTETVGAALSYNLRVGTTPGGSDIVSPLSLTDGTRLVPRDGNVGERTSYSLAGLASGTYYWSVQAVDSGFAGSAFSSESTFTTIPFTDIGASLTNVYLSSAAWGDYDSDGHLDILLAGSSSSTPLIRTSKIYKNDDDGSFSDSGVSLTGVSTGSVAWGDYDSDGDLDVLLTGNTGSGFASKIYKNNGNGSFSDSGVSLTGVSNGSVAWGDYNSDGKPDILLTGGSSSGRISKIYKNNGDGSFSEDTVAGSGLTAVYNGSVAWGDYNSDGKLDILLTGYDDSNRISKIYRNNGDGTFTGIDAGLTDVQYSSVAWGDYNSDGKPDILLTGSSSSGDISRIYRNDGGGTFTDIGVGLTPVRNGSVAWGDYNSDGDLDILLSGCSIPSCAACISKIYKNNGDGTFTGIDAGLTSVRTGSVAWGDYNSDGKPDILLTGYTAGLSRVSSVYQNYTATANTAPSAPDGLLASFSSGAENLSWNAASDSQTTAAALTYNLRVGTTSGGSDVVSSLSRSDGTRLLPKDGNVGERTSYALQNLPGGTYYWSVQAVDSGFAGSAFASEGTFIVPESFALSSATYSVNENGGSTTITINRAGSTIGPASVHFATANGSATAGSDYTDASQTVSFAAGETSKTVSVPITDDSLIEANETVSLSLSSPSADATLGSPSSATLTIADNDRAFALSSASYSVGEGGGSAAVTINRTGLTTGSDSVNFATANGTATAGSDYTAVNQTVSFAAGETTKTVSIPITNDSAVESSETVLLSLSSPSTGATLGSPSSATLTISDNDVAPPPPTTHPATTTSKGKIVSAKLSKKSFSSSQAGKVKLTCKFSPKSKIFRYVLSLKKGKKWAVVKSVKKTGFYKVKYTITARKLFAGKAVKRGAYRLKLSADKNSKALAFRVR